jgi:hypothetical protein
MATIPVWEGMDLDHPVVVLHAELVNLGAPHGRSMFKPVVEVVYQLPDLDLNRPWVNPDVDFGSPESAGPFPDISKHLLMQPLGKFRG